MVDVSDLLWWLAALGLVLVGCAGVIIPALPGVPLVFIGLWMAAWIDDYGRVGYWTLGVLGVLTLLAVVTDLLASALGAQRVGASSKAIWGALLGSMVGLFFGLPGLLLGPFIGAVAGELVARGGLDQAARVGIATWLGLLLGTLLKLAITLTMLGVFVAAWWL
jgi:uncharacterized protein